MIMEFDLSVCISVGPTYAAWGTLCAPRMVGTFLPHRPNGPVPLPRPLMTLLHSLKCKQLSYTSLSLPHHASFSNDKKKQNY